MKILKKENRLFIFLSDTGRHFVMITGVYKSFVVVCDMIKYLVSIVIKK